MDKVNCVRTERGLFINRVDFIDALQEISVGLQEEPSSLGLVDDNLIRFIKMLTAFGEPPEAEDGQSGSLDFDNDEYPRIEWYFDEEVGVYFSVIDIMQLILSVPLSYKVTKMLLHYLTKLIDPRKVES